WLGRAVDAQSDQARLAGLPADRGWLSRAWRCAAATSRARGGPRPLGRCLPATAQSACHIADEQRAFTEFWPPPCQKSDREGSQNPRGGAGMVDISTGVPDRLDVADRIAAPSLAPGTHAIDLAHLALMTFGERTLERDLLTLFDRQAAMLLAR